VSYTIKGGKIVRHKHNQAAVDSYCRNVVAMSKPISEADFLNVEKRRGTVTHVMIAHDDWCGTMKTGSGGDCNCNPRVTYHQMPRPSDIN
jgi:hypothetical protein